VLIRRKRVPDDLAPSLRGLRAVVVEVEAAKAAMIATVPSTRLPGAPLPDALLALDEHLRRARDLLPVWRHPQVEDEWRACGEGIDEALRRAAELREQAPDLGGFEGLIWAVDQLLEPLEAFEAAAERFRTLRR
jgi:hypothetical protein